MDSRTPGVDGARAPAALFVASLCVALLVPVAGQASHEIPSTFDTATSLLLTPVTINGKTFRCSIDSGFSALLTFDERLAHEAGLTPGPASPTPDGNPPRSGDHEARAIVGLGGVVLRDQPVILRRFFPEAPDMQCVMGVGILRNYIVEFDHEAPCIRLYLPDDFRPASATVVPLEVRRNTPVATVELQFTDGRRRRASLVVDTGASFFSVVVAPAFVESNRIRQTTLTAYQPSPGSFNPLAARLETVTVGPLTAHAQLAALLEASIGAGMDDGLLGAGFLQQFTVALDFVGQRMYLTPNTRFDASQSFDASGLAFRRDPRSHEYDIAVVLPGSAADRAGLQSGDRLLRVNGQPISAMTPADLRQVFSRDGATLRLELLRGAAALAVRLTLETRL